MDYKYITGALIFIVGFMVGYGYRPKRNHFITIKLNKMGEQLDAILVKVANMETGLNGIEQDITFIKSQLPTEGGMSAEDVAILNTRLDQVLSRVQNIDAQTDSTPPAPPVE